MEPETLMEAVRYFADLEICDLYMRRIKWPDGHVVCPYCGSERIGEIKSRHLLRCKDCRKQFSHKVGTIFEDTKLPLRKWFMAIWMITNHPKGIASTTLAKDLHITQKSAWFVLHRLRHASRTDSFNAPLDDTVETDTTFVGGKEKNKHADKRTPGSQGGSGKAVVVGVIERGGELRTAHIEDTKAKTIHSFVKARVEQGSDLMTKTALSSA